MPLPPPKRRDSPLKQNPGSRQHKKLAIFLLPPPRAPLPDPNLQVARATRGAEGCIKFRSSRI
jgi:hypothetical protein